MPLNITIIGLDTIGGSLGLALGTLDKEALPSGRPVITGWDDRRRLRDARGRLMIDREARDVAEAVRDADVVFVSVPPSELDATFNSIAPHLKHGTIVTDTGSAKVQALEAAQHRLPTTIDYIGGHPLVHLTDKQNASIDLFQNAIYCLVSGLQTRPNALDTLAELITAIGAKPYYIDAAEHDAYVAGAEQLPIIASAALMEAVSRSGGWREMQPIAGQAFSSATQLANTDPEATSGFCQSNSAAIERWLNDYIRVLVEIRDNLRDPDQLDAIFSHARAAHQQWLEAQPNMRPGESEYYGQHTQTEPDRGIGSLLFGHRKKKTDQDRGGRG